MITFILLTIVIGGINARLSSHLHANGPVMKKEMRKVETSSTLVVDPNAAWFHAHSQSGTWSVGGLENDVMPAWTKLRYNFHNTPCTTKSMTPHTTFMTTDISFLDFRIIGNVPVIMDVQVTGLVSKLKQTNRTNIRMDILNVFVDGNRIYQASSSSVDVNNGTTTTCQMGDFVVHEQLYHHNGWEDTILLLRPGMHSISIEVRTDPLCFHDQAFYEIQFMMTPMTVMT